jgi:hypothetical protein
MQRPFPNGQKRSFGCNGYDLYVLQRPWPLAKANGFILVWKSLTGVISVRLLRSCGVPGSPLNGRG